MKYTCPSDVFKKIYRYIVVQYRLKNKAIIESVSIYCAILLHDKKDQPYRRNIFSEGTPNYPYT